MKDFKIVNEQGVLLHVEYNESKDVFSVTNRNGTADDVFVYLPEEVEEYVNKGVWKRV